MGARRVRRLVAALAASSLATALVVWPAVVRKERAPAPSLVLVTWDTARADHVGPDARVSELTPRWNALASEGTRFGMARTPTPLTLPAHASLLTGLAPARHGARDNGIFALDPGVATLPEVLRAHGYRTAAFVSASVLDSRYALDRGFEIYDDAVGDLRERHAAERRGDATIDAALAWLAEVRAEDPVFLWVHLFDPHQPWEAPIPTRAPGGAGGYGDEIAFVDAQTARLLDALRRSGRLARSLVVVTADHGEGLGEHGEGSHGYFAYDSTLRVPLLLWSGRATGIEVPQALRVDEPVSLMDVVPTVSELLGLGGWPGDGRSLVPLLRGADWPPREIPLENVDPAYLYGAAPIFGVVDAAGHTWFDLPQRERYDPAVDPGQLANRYDPSQADAADRLFARHPRRWPPSEAHELDPEQSEQLAALGYLPTGGHVTPPAADAAPDPKDLLPVARLWMEETRARTPAAALAAADRLMERFGDLPVLAFYRADRLEELSRRSEAIAVLRSAHQAHPHETRLREDLERLTAQQARDAELARRIRDVWRAHPDHPGAPRDLATVLHRLGRFTEATDLYRRWLERHPEDDSVRLALHRALGAAGDLEASLAVLRAGRARDGHDPKLDCAEGRLLAFWLERPEQARPALRACRASGESLSKDEIALLEAGP